MCEDRELAPVHTSFICKGQGQIMCVSEHLLWGTRIVVPRLLRNRVVQLAYEGQLGIVQSIGSAVMFGGWEWTRMLRSFVEFVMAARSLLDMNPQS